MSSSVETAREGREIGTGREQAAAVTPGEAAGDPATIAALLRWGGRLLAGGRTAGGAAHEAARLLAHVLHREPAWLYAHGDESPAPPDAAAYRRLIAARRSGVPLAYLTGEVEFCGLQLKVTPAVLIPRPETETLVAAALERLAPGARLTVADLGTGCGAIALALAARRPDCFVIGGDLSPAALTVARDNARRLGLRVRFVCGSWFAPIPGNLDMVVANPPYVAAGDPHLADPELRHEPQLALTPGSDGLAALRQIAGRAPARLKPGGWLLLEHGYDQRAAAAELLAAAGFVEISGSDDEAGRPRVIAGRRPAD